MEAKNLGSSAVEYSSADIANFAWVCAHRWSGVDVDDVPHLKHWLAAIRERPTVQKSITIPPSSVDLSKDDPESAGKLAQDAFKMVQTGQSQQKKVWSCGHCNR